MKDTYLVTGAAGFIGFFLSKRLLEEGNIVVGIDNLNDYYDVNLKLARLDILKPFRDFIFHKIDISEKNDLKDIFEMYKFDYVINLAAQAGVRYSIENPDAYIKSNIIGFFNILEMCRYNPVKHLIYASSSSVYGNNTKVPFEETDNVDHPVSLYAATKKSNELMAATYSHLFNIPSTGLRFFTVYGPWGRPDMAYFSFTESYFKEKVIEVHKSVHQNTDIYRDFTYIDDVINATIKLLSKPPLKESDYFQLFNIGNTNPVSIKLFIETLESCISRILQKNIVFRKKFVPLSLSDVTATFASDKQLKQFIGYTPRTTIEEGLTEFVDWYIRRWKD